MILEAKFFAATGITFQEISCTLGEIGSNTINMDGLNLYSRSRSACP